MRVLLITGDHLRHKYMVAQLCQHLEVVGWIAEKRDLFIPEPPQGLSAHLSHLFVHHFAMRSKAENDFFADNASIPASLPLLPIDQSELNSRPVHDFLRQHPADVVISYGCHFLRPETLAMLPQARFLNVHGGLSPWYRGVATHFWPVYFLEPQMVGFTLHDTQKNLDGGSVLLQNSYSPVRGDTLHYIACRTTTDFVQKLGQSLAKYEHKPLPQGVPQSSSGRIFLSKEWRPEHLRMIYDFYADAVADALLNGEIQGRSEKLIDVLNTN